MIQHDYLGLVRSKDFDALTSAWDDAISNVSSIDSNAVETYCQTVIQLCDRQARDTALDLATRMVTALTKAERFDEAIRVGISLIRKEAHNEPFARQVLQVIETYHGEQPWYSTARSAANLGDEQPRPDAFLRFDRARRITPGNVVTHRAGWGEGIVQSYDATEITIDVEFHDGSTKVFKFEKAIDSLRPVDDDDLRAMRLKQPEKLAEYAESEPSALIRMAARIYRGSINSLELKSELTPSVIPTKKWASWWKRAKIAASHDPWLEIGGSRTRPIMELRKQPLSFASEANRRLDHALNIEEVLETTRSFLEQGLDQDAKNTILDLAQQRIEEALELERQAREGDDAGAEVSEKDQAARKANAAHLLDGLLFLEEHSRPASVTASEELRQLILDDGVLNPESIEALASKASKDLAIRLLPEALGEDWADRCIECITRFPNSDVEGVVNLLQEAGAAPRLADVWSQVAPYPKKSPALTYLLARLHADGLFKDVEGAPDPISVARVLLHLLRVIAKEPKSNTELQRLKSRITNAMVGRRAVLTDALESISRDDLAAFLGIAERGGEDFPIEVIDAILRVVAKKYPDITSKPEKPFWELDEYLFVTAPGLARRKEEHRHLVDVLIPKNAGDISAAAEQGDLSENSEWEAAMEEQRNLTGRAQDMTEELRKARLIEDQSIPEDQAAPGTRVTFTVLDENNEVIEAARTVRLLGPWDCIEDDILNYRAPMARAILGKRAGEEGHFKEQTIRVDSVSVIED